MRHLRFQRLIGVAVAGAMVLACVAVPASAATHHKTHHSKKIKKVHGTINLGVGFPIEADEFPLFYGLAKGIFKKYGITVNTTDLTPAAGVGALYSGSINLLLDGTGTLNEAVATGAVKAMGTFSQVPVWLVARPDEHLSTINTPSQLTELNGKVIGTTTPGSLVTDVEQALTHAAGAKVSYDYLGSQSTVSAVAHGIVDVCGAVPASLPVAKADGLVVIGSLNKLSKGHGLYTIVGGNNAFVKHHKKLVRQFGIAYKKALHEGNHNPAENISILQAALNVSHSEAAESYRLQKRYTFLKPIPLTDVRYDLNNIAAVLPAAGHAKYKQVVDNKSLFK